jgi:5-methylcytosine-specific restriction endonuclease McrA
MASPQNIRYYKKKSWKRRKHHPPGMDGSIARHFTGVLHVQAVQTAESSVPRAKSPRRGGVAAYPADLAPSNSLGNKGSASASQRPATSALSCSVLVLNRLYMAVHIVNVRRAIGLLCRELSEVIHLEEGKFATYSFESWREMSELWADNKQSHQDWIRSVNFEIQAPRVIRLLTYDRLPKQKLSLSRHNVLARDGHLCQYCGRHFPTHLLSIDHVVPRSRGGATTWENVVCACLSCNAKKGGRTPHEARMKLVQPPVRPKRNPMLLLKLDNPKYEGWRVWLDNAHWDVVAKD